MTNLFSPEIVSDLSQQLHHHPVYGALRDLADLRCFMQHHVFSVWDFMSLIKYLQHHIAPATYPWLPRGHSATRRFINSLVLEEESDEKVADSGEIHYSSHFELYCQAMREVGAETTPILNFIEMVKKQGIKAALNHAEIPEPSRQFTQTTFGFINSDRPHQVAAALAIGREQVIPNMFRAFLGKMAISEQHAPVFHYYLKRHIHLDEDFHAPLSLKLLDELCEGDAEKIKEAETAARQAISARLRFWDGVLSALNH